MFGRGAVIGALVLAVSFGAGCVSLSLHVDRPSYRSGESSYAEIRNGGWRAAYGNFCTTYGLERRCGSAWIPVERQQRMCTKELDGYAPGSVRAAVFHVPRDTPNGAYRLVTSVEAGGSDHRVTSNEFAVVGSAITADGCENARTGAPGDRAAVVGATPRPPAHPGSVSRETRAAAAGRTTVAQPPARFRLQVCSEAPVRLDGPPGAEQSRGCVATFTQELSDPATIRSIGSRVCLAFGEGG